MASSKVMASSTSRNSDPSRYPPSTHSPSTKLSSSSISDHNKKTNKNHTSMTVDGLLRNVYSTNTHPSDTTLLNADITLLDAATAATSSDGDANNSSIKESVSNIPRRTVDDVWKDIVAGNRKECKEEVPDDEMMTLEDFLARAGAVEEEDLKIPPPLMGSVSAGTERMSGGVFSFDPSSPSPFRAGTQVEGSVIGFGNGGEVIGGGRAKRRAAVLEPLDKAAQQRQRRMIKNRESAARSRERKQAYQVELEALAVKLEEENERLLKEKAQRTKERFKLLMEKVVPVVEQRRPARVLRRVRSMQW